MKKYLWVFWAAVPLCSFANENAMNLGDSVIDVVKCESTKGEKLWVALNNLKTFTYMKNDVNVADQTIDITYKLMPQKRRFFFHQQKIISCGR